MKEYNQICLTFGKIDKSLHLMLAAALTIVK